MASEEVRRHLAEAGRKGGQARWANMTPDERRAAIEAPTKARGRVADALERVDNLEALVVRLQAEVADLRQQVAA